MSESVATPMDVDMKEVGAPVVSTASGEATAPPAPKVAKTARVVTASSAHETADAIAHDHTHSEDGEAEEDEPKVTTLSECVEFDQDAEVLGRLVSVLVWSASDDALSVVW
jgi:hypothetical protein